MSKVQNGTKLWMTAGGGLPLGAMLAASVFAAAGCGKSAKPLTRAQLLVRADAICRRVNKKLSSTTIKTQQDLVRALPRLSGYEQEGLADLSKLIPPPSMENDWKVIIAGAQTIADNTAKLSESAKAKDLRAVRALITEIGKVEQHTAAIAKRNGFKACAETP
jgi:hypothetical protein